MGYSSEKFTARACFHWLGPDVPNDPFGDHETIDGFEEMFFGADSERVDHSFEGEDEDEIKEAMRELIRQSPEFTNALVDSYFLVMMAGNYVVTSTQYMDDWDSTCEATPEWSTVRLLEEKECRFVDDELDRQLEDSHDR